jgi:predicted  nucleic acid-binding Zn-ribbon protein
VDKEYNELKSKSQEAEQEFKLAQSKVSDAREQLTKLRKDLDGKIFSTFTFYQVGKVKKFHFTF